MSLSSFRQRYHNLHDRRRKLYHKVCFSCPIIPPDPFPHLVPVLTLSLTVAPSSSYAHLGCSRSTIHDTIQSTGFWPEAYDGRAIIGPSYRDHLAGISNSELVTAYNKCLAVGDTEGRWIV